QATSLPHTPGGLVGKALLLSPHAQFHKKHCTSIGHISLCILLQLATLCGAAIHTVTLGFAIP
ncbi:MAG: hypothetical protein ACK50D_15285, partial [Burkholderiales bacterium]